MINGTLNTWPINYNAVNKIHLSTKSLPKLIRKLNLMYKCNFFQMNVAFLQTKHPFFCLIQFLPLNLVTAIIKA